MIVHFDELPHRLSELTARLIRQRPQQADLAHKPSSFGQALHQTQQEQTAAEARSRDSRG